MSKIISGTSPKPIKKQKVPQVGDKYFFFDDGKITYSRMYQAKVVKVVPYNEATDFLKNHFKNEVLDHDWLYAKETDYFIGCEIKDYDENIIWFVRTVDGGWFSMDIQSYWQGGRLDVSGECEEYLTSLFD